MTKYFFAALRPYEKLPGGNKQALKRDKIAKQVGGKECGYIYYPDPCNPSKIVAYGFCPNQGEPFNSNTAREIQAAWKEHGV
jgi:hypothetical protein